MFNFPLISGKNSSVVISRRSHSFLRVVTIALLLHPAAILLVVDTVVPLILPGLLIEILRFKDNWAILCRKTSFMIVGITSFKEDETRPENIPYSTKLHY